MFQSIIEKDIAEILAKIKFPKAKELLQKLDLTCRYYDLTIEDFNDKKLLEELESNKIFESKDIKEIVTFQTVFAVAK